MEVFVTQRDFAKAEMTGTRTILTPPVSPVPPALALVFTRARGVNAGTRRAVIGLGQPGCVTGPGRTEGPNLEGVP